MTLAACGGGGAGDAGTLTSPTPVQPGAVTPLPAALSVQAPGTAEVGIAQTLAAGLAATGTDLRYDWDFGDGQRSTEAQPSHAWSVAGRYTWRLTVHNGANASITASGSVQVGWFARLNGSTCTGGNLNGWCHLAASDFFATDLQCADALNCVARGSSDHLAYTRDGGRSWGLSRIPSIGTVVTHLRMANADTVYALSGQGLDAGGAVWRSSDGGRNWALLAEPSTPLLQSAFGGAGRFWVLDAQTLVASNASGWISRDGGSTWTALSQPVQDVSASGLLWADAALSGDLGQTWRPVPTGLRPGGAIRKVLARESSSPLQLHLLVRESVPGSTSVAPRLLRLASGDGGQTFFEDLVRLPTGVAAEALSSAVLRADGSGDAVVESQGDGVLMHTANHGFEWTAQALVTGTNRAYKGAWLASDGLAAIVRVADLSMDAGGSRGHFELVDLRTGGRSVIEGDNDPLASTWVDRVGGAVLLRRGNGGNGPVTASSNDLGRSWTPLPRAPVMSGASVGPLFFFDATNGLATQPLAGTADGGRSWQGVPTSSVPWPGDRWRPLPDGSVMLLGKPGMYRSTDRGQSWAAVPMPEVFDPGADFIDASQGWTSACQRGADGLCSWSLVRTVNGGQRWDPVWPVPAGDFVNRLAFVSASDGVMQRGDGSVWWTADGGLSWARARTLAAGGAGRDTTAYGRIVADRSQTLWMLGASTFDDVLLRSTDRGRSWRVMNLPIEASATPQIRLRDVASADGRSVWVVGQSGLVLKSTDGGEAWRVQASGTREDLLNAFALDAQTVWLAGFSLLLSTATGGD